MTEREEFEAKLKLVDSSLNQTRDYPYDVETDDYDDYLINNIYHGFKMGVEHAKAQAVPQWIPLSERLPDEDYGYFLVTRKYWNDGDPHVCYSFYIKDRDMAKREHANGYSRKYQGKDSIHFERSRYGFVITHWMPLPAAPEQQK